MARVSEWWPQARALLGVRRRTAFRTGRSNRPQLAGVILLLVIGLPVAGLIAAGTHHVFTSAPEPWPETALVFVCVALWLVWVFGSLFFGPFNEAIDVSRLLSYPVRREALVATLLGGSLLDVPTLFVVPVVVAVLSVWGDGMEKLGVGAALVLLWFHVVLAGQIVAGVFSGLFHNRRFRDIVAGCVAVLGMSAWGAHVASESWQKRAIEILTENTDAIHGFAQGVLSWTPPGSIARGISLVAGGEWLSSLAWFGYALIWLVVAGRVWIVLLDRLCANGGSLFRVRESSADGGGTRPRGIERGGPLVALVRKEIRMMIRTPALRVRLLQAIFMPIVLAFIMLKDEGVDPAMAMFIPTGMMLLLTMSAHQNGFGYEGAPMSAWMTSPLPRGHVFHAWMISHGFVAVPFVVVVGGVLGILTRDVPAVLGGVVLALSGDVIMSGVMFVTSLYVPFTVQQGRRSVQPRAGKIGPAFIVGLVAPFASILASAPAWAPVLLVYLKWGTAVAVGSTLWSVVFASAVYYFVVRSLSAGLAERETRIFSVVRSGRTE